MVTATATAATAVGNVTRHTWDGMKPDDDWEQYDKMKPVLEKWAGKLEKNIHVYNPHGIVVPYDAKKAKKDLEKGLLRIYFFSCSSEANYPPADYFSYFGKTDIADLGPSYKPTGLGAPILDDEGLIVGEYNEGVLYVFFDLPEYKDAGEILDKIMESARPVMSGEVSVEEIIAEQKRLKKERVLKRWLEVCQKRANKDKDKFEKEREKTQNKIDDLSTQLLAATREFTVVNEQLELVRMRKDETASFEAEFRSLLNTEGIATVELNEKGDVLKVTTDPIVSNPLVLDKSRRAFGAFEISYYVESDQMPEIKGLNPVVRPDGVGVDHFHPHVPKGSRPCWGNIGTITASLSAEREFAGLTQLLLTYLRTPNELEDVWGKYAYAWPVEEAGVDDDGNTIEPIPTHGKALMHCFRCTNLQENCTC